MKFDGELLVLIFKWTKSHLLILFNEHNYNLNISCFIGFGICSDMKIAP